ncbi:MAG: thioredoxin family protein [Proteobacteria bacterium]|nr:thioredoxin family protein [Pseudomonadota bacterium]
MAGFKGVLLAAVMIASLACAPRPDVTLPWRAYRPGALAAGIQHPRPVMVLFTSEECWFCDQMERRTLSHKDVLALGSRFVLIKVELARSVAAAEGRRLVAAFGLRKTPTVVFLDRRGREVPALRLVGFAWPRTLLRHMRAALRPDPRY